MTDAEINCMLACWKTHANDCCLSLTTTNYLLGKGFFYSDGTYSA